MSGRWLSIGPLSVLAGSGVGHPVCGGPVTFHLTDVAFCRPRACGVLLSEYVWLLNSSSSVGAACMPCRCELQQQGGGEVDRVVELHRRQVQAEQELCG